MNGIEAKVITDLKTENEHLKRLLHDLTPGGSEFYNDPEYCAKWIRESRTSNHYSLMGIIKKEKEENKRLLSLNEGLVEALKRLIHTAEEMADDANIGWGNDSINEAQAAIEANQKR